jgi:hypothetical protein
VSDLRRELARVGIRGRLARRIELELADHLACDPDARLGSPRLIAQRFADELRLPLTRRATRVGFGALAATAAGLAAQSLHSWPDIATSRGLVVALAGLTVAVAAQIAFVAGVLAVWGLWLGADPALVQRRLLVALAAGAVVVCGEGVDVAVLQPVLPAWWLPLALPATLVPAAGLAGAGVSLRTAAALTPAPAAPARPFTRGAVLSIGAASVALMVVGSAIAEHSWAEGLSRGVAEAVAFAVGFLALGRFLGVRR